MVDIPPWVVLVERANPHLLWDWLGRKDSNLRSPDPESTAAEDATLAAASRDSCSDRADALSSHLRFSGESGAQPRKESGAHAKFRKNQVPSRERLRVEIVLGGASRGQLRSEVREGLHP
jgi:hypothetical protein